MNRSLYIITIFLVLILCLPSCANYNASLRKPGILDGVKYGRVALPPSKSDPYIHKRTTENIQLPELIKWAGEKAARKYDSVDEFLAENKTSALLIVRNDSIIYEQYFNGFSDTSITQVFSITKPLIASFLGSALEEGRIEKFETPVANYLPLKGNKQYCEDLTLGHLAQMQSGFNHHDYFRIAKVLRLYYAKDADHYVSKARVSKEPGKAFKYKSFDTQVLGMCLEKIFEEENLYNRFVETYWDAIGPEHKAYFSIDDPSSNNMKYYGGLNISARDLAKIGKVYLNGGQFEDQQVMPTSYIDYLEDTTNHQGKWDYNMGWYFDDYTEQDKVYYGSGFNGQFLTINKDNNTIIVRLGTGEGKFKWWSILTELSTLF